jgi:hypothetical protein
MVKPTVAELMAVESRLNWSLAAAVVAVLSVQAWTFLAGRAGPKWVALGLAAGQLCCYAWFAVAAGRAARVLGEPSGRYIAWILTAPFLALIPIPIVSSLIGGSPLSIKFLLGSQLQERIRQGAFEE